MNTRGYKNERNHALSMSFICLSLSISVTISFASSDYPLKHSFGNEPPSLQSARAP